MAKAVYDTYALDFYEFTLFRSTQDPRSTDIDLWSSFLVPFQFDISKFKIWLESKWTLMMWKYSDWREAPDPNYKFVIRNESLPQVGIPSDFSGFLSEDMKTLCIGCTGIFLFEFCNEFINIFPGNDVIYVSIGYDLHITSIDNFKARDDFLQEIHDHDEIVKARNWLLLGGRI
jgi:hypothetical protein